MERIAIIGMGLIGGSIGLALKGAGLSGLRIVGYSRRSEARDQALKRGAVDEVAANLASCVAGARMVVLAIPVGAMEIILRDMAPHLQEGCVVTDTASTKVQVLGWAQEALPPRISFVGGHPMAGKERAGIEAAEADIFHECIYCLCPGPGASPQAVEAVVGMVNLLGGQPYFLDPAEHDSFVAGISHLPMLLSTVLVSTTTGSRAWKEMARLAASGYRDISRLASSDPVMSRDIYLTNRESLLRWMDAFAQDLGRFRELIAQGSPDLEGELRRAKEARDGWLPGQVREERAAVPVEGWPQLFLGGLAARRLGRAGPKGR